MEPERRTGAGVVQVALMGLLSIGLGWLGLRGPKLDAASVYDLYESSERMKRELRLTVTESDALDGALDVLVGDAVRGLLDVAEPSTDAISVVERIEVEARILAPVDGLSFEEVVASAADTRHHERVAALISARQRVRDGGTSPRATRAQASLITSPSTAPPTVNAIASIPPWHHAR